MANDQKRRDSIRASDPFAGGLQNMADWLTGEPQQEHAVIPANAMLYQEDGSIRAGNFTLTRTGLLSNDFVTHEEWQELGHVLKGLNQSLQWLIGDWVVYGEDNYRLSYDEIAEQTGLDKTTLYDYAYVARAVHFSVRTEMLSFSHHKLVASFQSRKQQKQWLDYAAAEHLSVNALRAAIVKQGLLSGPSAASKMDMFSQDYTRFAKRHLKNAKKMGGPERRQMADLLRKLADEIEGLE